MRITLAILAVLIVAVLPVMPTKGVSHTAPFARVSNINSPPQPSPQVREAEIHRILSRSEFSGAQPGIVERVSDWFGRVIGQVAKAIFGNIASNQGDAKWISVALAVVVLSLFLVLLAFVLSKIGLGKLIGARAEDVDDIYAGPGTPNLALEEASRAAASGDFRSALRLVYLAVLLRLDEREMIRFDRTGTNWEYLAELRARPKVHQLLRPVTVTFDHKWYGHEASGEGDYRSFLEVYDAVEIVEAQE